MRELLLIVAMVGTPVWAQPEDVRYVDCGGGDNDNDGLTWATAKGTLDGGFNSVPGDRVPELYVRGSCIMVDRWPGSDECYLTPSAYLPAQGVIMHGPAGLRSDCPWQHKMLAHGRGTEETKYVLEEIHSSSIAISFMDATVELRDSSLIGMNARNVDLTLLRCQIRGRGEPEDGFSFSSTGPGRLTVKDSVFDGYKRWSLGVGLANVGTFPPITVRSSTFHGQAASFNVSGASMATILLKENILLDSAGVLGFYATQDSRITAVLLDNVFTDEADENPEVEAYGNVRVVGQKAAMEAGAFLSPQTLAGGWYEAGWTTPTASMSP